MARPKKEHKTWRWEKESEWNQSVRFFRASEDKHISLSRLDIPWYERESIRCAFQEAAIFRTTFKSTWINVKSARFTNVKNMQAKACERIEASRAKKNGFNFNVSMSE